MGNLRYLKVGDDSLSQEIGLPALLEFEYFQEMGSWGVNINLIFNWQFLIIGIILSTFKEGTFLNFGYSLERIVGLINILVNESLLVSFNWVSPSVTEINTTF